MAKNNHNEVTKAECEEAKVDPRWIRTRERLLGAGFALLGTAGTDGVSIDAIIASAGISKQTFYNHFKDREALTQALWLESRRRFTEKITRANAGVKSPALRLASAVAMYAALAIDEPAHVRFIARTHMGRALLDDANRSLEHDLGEGEAQGQFRLVDFADRATAAMFVVGVTWALVEQLLDTTDRCKAADICRHTLKLLLRGLGCKARECNTIAAQASAVL